MANPKGNPNIAKAGKKTRFNGCSAVEAGKKGAAVTNAMKSAGREIREYVTDLLNADDDAERKALARTLIDKSKENLDWYKYMMTVIREAPVEQTAVEMTQGIVLLPKQEIVDE